MIREQKKENSSHFVARNWNYNTCHIMKANIIAMENETDAEVANGILVTLSKANLQTWGIMVELEGMYQCIRALRNIGKINWVLLGDSGNGKDYPYGT